MVYFGWVFFLCWLGICIFDSVSRVYWHIASMSHKREANTRPPNDTVLKSRYETNMSLVMIPIILVNLIFYFAEQWKQPQPVIFVIMLSVNAFLRITLRRA